MRTVTLVPLSVAVAFLVQTRARLAEPSRAWSWVQPVGPVMVPVLVLAVMNSSIVSPAMTVAGTLTTWLVVDPAALAAPT